ncbi:MAG TPA: xanthine dehydrogenase family protein subunit M [Terriglobales bacterium]|jgi:carbon-monoxide dehydrogenase medium subunit|nr:xanthine dehydrogenase family protein subunit M [Terriglobales bacterium]
MIPANFDYESPRTLSEALDLLASREDAKVLAGGHSLLPAMKLRLAQPSLLVDIGRIGGLSYIRESGDQILIGAMTNHAEVAASKLLQRSSPLLAQTATEIGDTQVRNRGTIGGSLAQAHPSADYPAAILALDAELVVHSRKGERVIPATKFFTGMFSTQLHSDEILTEIRVPKTAGEGTAYKKFHHPASGYAVVGTAVRLKMSGGKADTVAIGITGVSDIAYRATQVENALRGKPASAIADAAAHATDGVEVLGDYYASTEYRRHLAEVLTRRALAQAAAGRKP